LVEVVFVPVAFVQTRPVSEAAKADKLAKVPVVPFRLSAFTVVPEAVVKPSHVDVTPVKVPFVAMRFVRVPFVPARFVTKRFVEVVFVPVAFTHVSSVGLKDAPEKLVT
jgi:hypothetical protein